MEALNVFNDCAQHSRGNFDAHLEEAGLLDSVWDPAGFANVRVDRLMMDSIAADVADLLTRAGTGLSTLSTAFSAIGEALAAGDPLDTPDLTEPDPALPQVSELFANVLHRAANHRQSCIMLARP